MLRFKQLVYYSWLLSLVYSIQLAGPDSLKQLRIVNKQVLEKTEKELFETKSLQRVKVLNEQSTVR